MNARPMMMLSYNDGGCGCSQTGNATPVCPPSGATVADPRYLVLTSAPVLQVLGVPSGSNTQSFLKGSTGARGFLFYEGGNTSIDADPTLTLPFLNAPTSGSYPATGSFQAITVGSGNLSSLDWRHLAAPTSGKWTLQSNAGSWGFVDAGTIPGLNEIASSGVTTLKGEILASVEVTTGVFAIRKLRSTPGRVITGFLDDVTGDTGYTMLPTTSFLEHPKGRFNTLQSYTYQATDVNDNPVSAGLPTLIVTGVGAITDAVSVFYSGTTKQFYFAAPATTGFLAVSTNTGSVTVPSSYASIPSGHGAGVSRVFNYPTVMITFFAGMGASVSTDTLSFAIYKDGALLQEFDNDNIPFVALQYVDQNVTLGSHTYDIRWKRTSGTDQVAMRNSSFLVRTLA